MTGTWPEAAKPGDGVPLYAVPEEPPFDEEPAPLSPQDMTSEEYFEARVKQMLGELIDTDGLDGLPMPVPILGDLLFEDSYARVVGPSGSMKSFIVLDMAGHIGTGMEWHGQYVKQGTVVYLVAEGSKGIRKRVRAWEQHYGVRMDNVHFLTRPVQAMSPEWGVLTEVCKRMEASLIIVDTQARVTLGIDENSNTEMGKVIDRMEEMRKATGACVMPIHHTGHLGEHGRGASAVKGALDSELLVSKKGDRVTNILITLKTGKQKDEEEGDEIVFSLKQVRLNGEAKPDGSPVTSVVLLTGDQGKTPADVLADRMDRLNIPVEWGRRKVTAEFGEQLKARNELLGEAIKIRRDRSPIMGTALDEHRSPLFGTEDE